MTTSARGWGCQIGLASFLAMGFALALGGGLSPIATSGDCAHAQIRPDSTLGTESSVVTPQAPGSTVDVISGGATRGASLFHSFEEFSVPTGGAAFFNNGLEIQNIISRVTGGSISNIDGLLQANGTANLFLINPNGIIFGPNATLSIGGSFLASTASSLNFTDGTQFSATNPKSPPLLRVSVPIGLQYGGTAGDIQVQQSILQVQSGQTLALMGGDVSVEGGEFGFFKALGGRVELGGLAGTGMVQIEGQQSEGTFRLTSLRFPDSVERKDVSLTNLAYVNVAASGGGSIAINARNFNLSKSALVAGIGENLGSIGSQAGDITLNAAGTITIANSLVFNDVEPGGMGNGGNININARSLSITDDAQLSASTFGRGNSGSIFLQADNSVSLARDSAVFNQVQAGGVGNGGDINITAGSLSLTDGAQLQTFVGYDSTGKSPNGRGNAGDVNINVRDTVTLVGKGRDSDTYITAIWTGVGFGAVGNGGDINIIAKALSLTNAPLGADTNGQGDAGNVFVRVVDSIYLTNTDLVLEGSRRSRIGSVVGFLAVGNGGDIDIQSRSLFLDNGAVLDASTQGKGNGGNIRVSADTFAATNGGQIFTTTRSSGRAGSISLNVTDSVTLSGSDPKFAQRRDRSEPSIIIPDSPTSGLFARTEGAGAAGNLQITTGQLAVRDGAAVSAATSGAGQGGRLTVRASESVELIGTSADGRVPSGLSTATLGIGAAGDLSIETGQLIVRDQAQVTVSSQGSRNAGNLQFTGRSIFLDNEAKLQAETALGNGGSITLRVQDLLLMRHGSRISTTAGTAQAGGDGGNITIDTDFIVAVNSENSDISANAQNARGGRVIIDAQGIFGTEFREIENPATSDITATSELGPEFSGTVEINTPDVDPSRGLVNLPAELVDASNQIAQSCPGSGRQGESKFIVTGRGGLPPNPSDLLNSDAVWVDLDSTTQLVQNRSSSEETTQMTNSTKEPLVEATGWVIDDKGQVVLIASAPTATPDSPELIVAKCYVP